MMTCVSDRSGMASRVMFLIEYDPANVAIPMKRKTMNLLCAENSIILLIIASLLFLRWLMLRMVLMLRMAGLRCWLAFFRHRFLFACRAAAVAHARHAHPARRRLQPAFGINQEVSRGHDPLACLQPTEH